MFDKAFLIAVAIAGVTEWLKNLLPTKVKENKAVMAVIAAVIGVVGAVGYQFTTKAINPTAVLTWQTITAFTVIVVGLTQTAYSLLIQTFKSVVAKLKSKVETPIDTEQKADEIADTIISKVEGALADVVAETAKSTKKAKSE